ncbi:hypothetical protein CBS14141_002281 [Malassezia furfur]|nr:hypothetical protein CBS14141_002281 [Malassezia furfur]
MTSVPPLVMQLIVDRALIKHGWTMGPMMAQAAHAATAVLARTADRADTQAYVAPEHLGSMHKIVLQTPKNTSLVALAAQLEAAGAGEVPPYHLWIEKPEHVPTCLAIAPNRKPEALVRILKKCTLLRD